MQFNGNHLFAADSLKSGYCIFDRTVDIKVVHMQRTPFGVQFIQGQKTLGQLFQTFGLINHDFQITILHLRWNRSVHDRFHKTLD